VSIRKFPRFSIPFFVPKSVLSVVVWGFIWLINFNPFARWNEDILSNHKLELCQRAFCATGRLREFSIHQSSRQCHTVGHSSWFQRFCQPRNLASLLVGRVWGLVGLRSVLLRRSGTYASLARLICKAQICSET
jgi:ABC-type sugar transport system permease subunit